MVTSLRSNTLPSGRNRFSSFSTIAYNVETVEDRRLMSAKHVSKTVVALSTDDLISGLKRTLPLAIDIPP
jgi:hypothetical protein